MTIALAILSGVLIVALYQASAKIVRLRAERREVLKSLAEIVADDLVEDGVASTVKVTIGDERYIVSTDDTEGPEQ